MDYFAGSKDQLSFLSPRIVHPPSWFCKNKTTLSPEFFIILKKKILIFLRLKIISYIDRALKNIKRDKKKKKRDGHQENIIP